MWRLGARNKSSCSSTDGSNVLAIVTELTDKTKNVFTLTEGFGSWCASREYQNAGRVDEPVRDLMRGGNIRNDADIPRALGIERVLEVYTDRFDCESSPY